MSSVCKLRVQRPVSYNCSIQIFYEAVCSIKVFNISCLNYQLAIQGLGQISMCTFKEDAVRNIVDLKHKNALYNVY